jgi:hypothetical protein
MELLGTGLTNEQIATILERVTMRGFGFSEIFSEKQRHLYS